MQIALLSLPMTWNYGGILQQFALQEVLTDMGHSTHILCRRQTRKNILIKSMVKLKWLAIPAMAKNLDLKKYPLFAVEHFKSNHLRNMTTPLYSNTDLINYVEKNLIDAVVVGSDQVWNKWAVPDLFNYYLDFCENKSDLIRIAYAPSFSKPEWDYTDSERVRCSELLQKFNAISTREHIGVAHCRDQLKVDAKLLPDPTLLLTAEQYIEKIGLDKIDGKDLHNYIFSYILDPDLKKSSSIIEACQYFNAGVISFPSSFNDNANNKKNATHDQTVENWINMIRHSRFVITDSFHGMIFAIIFNKPFIAFPNIKRGFERFSTIGVELNVSGNFIFDKDDLNKKFQIDLDWTTINKKIFLWASLGKSFLINTLNQK